MALGGTSSGRSGIATLAGFRDQNPDELPLFTGTLEQYQEDVLAQNLGVGRDANKLADLVNTSNVQQLLKIMETLLPGYGGVLKQGVENAAALMRGELPEDVRRQIQDYSAERNIGRGISGSEIGEFGELRSLGLTSLEAQRGGQQQFQSLVAGTPRPPQFDFTTMFLSPAQKAQFELQKYQVNLPVQQFNNWVRTLPTNLERFGAQALDYVADFATVAAGAGMGGIGGGAGGAGIGGMMGGSTGTSGGGGQNWYGGGSYLSDFYSRGPQ